MKRKRLCTLLAIAGAGALALPLAGCEQEPDSPSEALEQAGDAAEDAVDEVEDAMDEAVDN